MRKALVIAGVLAAVAAVAPTASADERRCYSPDFNGVPVLEKFPTTDQCIFLPVDLELE